MPIQIKTLEDLHRAALDRKSVIVPNSSQWNKPKPAAFYMNWIGGSLLNLFSRGLYVYERQPKGESSKPYGRKG